jgi:hypothetical protein
MGRFWTFLTVLLAFAALSPGRLRADQDNALTVLEAKGLKRSVSNFALPEETDFNKQMRATEALKKKLADAPKVQLQMADGHTVVGQMVYADKVRVGKFTAEHVECAVLPAEFSEAAPLLGLSFWRNFIFKIDAEKAKLVMSKVDVPEKPARTPRGRKASAQ